MATILKETDGTIKVTITIPWADVAKTWDTVVGAAVTNTTLPGFRKGKAPKKMVEDSINKDKVREEVLKKLLPQYYIEAVKEHKLQPIINPKIHVEKLEEGQEWQFSATTCETPTIDLGDYKSRVQSVTAKQKIIIPGKEKQEPNFDEIMKTLVDGVSMTIPVILIEQEVDRLLAQMLDEIKSLGLSLEQYLASTKRSVEDVRAEYRTRAEHDIKIEFVIQKIAEVEKIAVEEKEVEEAIQKAKDPAEQKNLEANKYLLAAILRQQKTLDFLKNL